MLRKKESPGPPNSHTEAFRTQHKVSSELQYCQKSTTHVVGQCYPEGMVLLDRCHAFSYKFIHYSGLFGGISQNCSTSCYCCRLCRGFAHILCQIAGKLP